MSKEGSPGSQERLERSGKVVAEGGEQQGCRGGDKPALDGRQMGGRHAQERGFSGGCCRREYLQPGAKPVQRERLRLGGGGATEG